MLLIASQYAALSRAFYYGYDGLIPHSVLVLFAWLFTVQLFLVLFSLIKDAGLALRYLKKKSPFANRAKLSFYTLIAAVAVASWTNYTALKQPPVTEQTIWIKNLPEAFEGYRIAQLSDIHTSALLGRERNKKIVDQTNALHPDLIVITGDLVDGTLEARQNDLLPFSELHAKDGVIAIEGNHEHYVAHEDWRKFFPTLGFHWLENEHEIIEKSVEFPKGTPKEVTSLITGLLKKKPSQRIKDFNTVQNEPLFKDYPWESLLQFKVKPFWVPDKDPRDNPANLDITTSPFEVFMEHEKFETIQMQTLRINNTKETNKNASNVNAQWFNDF